MERPLDFLFNAVADRLPVDMMRVGGHFVPRPQVDIERRAGALRMTQEAKRVAHIEVAEEIA